MAKEQRRISAPVIVACITVVGTILVAVLPQFITSEEEKVSLFFQCEAQLLEQQEKNIDILKRLEKTAKLALENMTHRDQLRNFIDAFPDLIAFIKIVKGDRIEMLMINDAYESAIGISKEMYEGKTDLEVHEESVGLKHLERDERVISVMDGINFGVVTVRNKKTGEQKKYVLQEFVFKLHGEEELAIAGVGAALSAASATCGTH